MFNPKICEFYHQNKPVYNTNEIFQFLDYDLLHLMQEVIIIAKLLPVDRCLTTACRAATCRQVSNHCL